MAQSRLEKIGSIYTRMKSLLEKNGIPINNKPLWYDLYEAFPPKYEPSYNRPILTSTLKPILYEEDKIRTKFQKNYEDFLFFDLCSKNPSSTEIFIKIYKNLEQKNYSEVNLYKSAMEEFSKVYKYFKINKREKIFKNNELKNNADKQFLETSDVIEKNNAIHQKKILKLKENELDEKNV